MAINTVQIFSRGGRELVDLLSHCVLSINTDTLFLYLVREYQLHPQATCAIALHDVFCGAQAPARISDPALIPPKDLRLHNHIAQLRAAIEAVEAFRAADQRAADQRAADQRATESKSDRDERNGSEVPLKSSQADGESECSPQEDSGIGDESESGTQHPDPAPPPPPAIPLPPRYLFDSVASQLAGNSSKLNHLESYYDPRLSPLENLPGGELNPGQRAFVDNVWTPLIRPYLVSSGFWRIATIG